MSDIVVMDTNRKTFSIRQTIPNSTLVQKLCNYLEMTKAKEKKSTDWHNARAGYVGMTSHIVLILFHEPQGNPVFGVISLNHCKFLLSQLKFDDFTTKLAKYGILFKYIKANLYPFTFSGIVYAGKPKKILSCITLARLKKQSSL